MHLSGSSRALIIHGEGGRLALTNPLLLFSCFCRLRLMKSTSVFIRIVTLQEKSRQSGSLAALTDTEGQSDILCHRAKTQSSPHPSH